MATSTSSAAAALSTAGTHIPDRTPSLIITSTVFLLITTAFFTTRLIWRFTHNQRGWDDLLAALAYITLVIMTSFLYTSAHYGFGKHRIDILPTFATAIFWFYMYQICYKILGGLTKLCFCALYLRLFDAKRTFCKVAWFTAGIIAAGTVAFTFGTIFQCTPIKRNWDHVASAGSCIDFAAFWYAHAVFNTLMDIVVFTLPIPLISTLKMKQRTKTGLMAVFALGAFTIAASTVRMVVLRGSARSSKEDVTWGSASALVWTEIEANTAVVCCCLPALRVCAVRGWRRIVGGEKGVESSDVQSGGGKGVVPPAPGLGVAAAEPGKQATVFSQIRYSPPPTTTTTTTTTTESSLEREDGEKETHSSVLDRLGLRKKSGASGSSESDGEGNGTPELELGHVKTSRDFKHYSIFARGDDEREVDIYEMLRAGPPVTRGRRG